MVMPPWPRAGLACIPAHLTLAGFARGFNVPPGPAHSGQRLQRRLRRRVGQIVTRLAATQVLAVEDPNLRPRMAPGGGAHPLRAAAVGTGALRALHHGHLLPRAGRQVQAAFRERVPLPRLQCGRAGVGRSPDREGCSRSVSAATRLLHFRFGNDFHALQMLQL